LFLFVSDTHFGRDAPDVERTREQDLVACLRAHAPSIERLFIVGDLFDAYIEYRHLVPKGAVRVLALLAEWTARGIPVTYLVGNHDPWHRDYFSESLGVDIHMDEAEVTAHGRRVYIHHGDGLAPTSRRYNALKPWLRHPLPVWIYKNLLPGDAGMTLARKVAHRLAQADHSEANRMAYRTIARAMLGKYRADAVVMGHTHAPEHMHFPEGEYINLGAWYQQRTFATLNDAGFQLMRWNGTSAEPVEATALPSTAARYPSADHHGAH